MERIYSLYITNRNYLLLLNRYYMITRFYPFLKNVAIKAAILIVSFVLLLVGLEYFFLDFNTLLTKLVETFSAKYIFLSLFVSETLLGLLPPEVYIAWAAKSVSPWLFLFVLASMSYLGGIAAYFIGRRLFLVPKIKNYMENKVSTHIRNLRKWGGLFVFIGAMLPIPHSMVSMASGLIRYNFKYYLLFALFRYVRFVLYALVIFQIF